MAQKLKVNVKPTFSAPVLWRLAGDDGQVTEVPFTAVFRRVSGDEAKAIQAKLESRDLTDSQLLDRVLAGWDKLLDDAGEPYVFTPENRQAARDEWPTFEAAIVFAYFEHSDAAVVKNS